MRSKDAGLAFETEDRTVNVRFLQQHTGVVGQVTSGEIISAIHDDVVFGNDIHGVLAADTRFMDYDFGVWIDAENRLLRVSRAVGQLHHLRRIEL